jgi:hypothetical protein
VVILEEVSMAVVEVLRRILDKNQEKHKKEKKTFDKSDFHPSFVPSTTT